MNAAGRVMISAMVAVVSAGLATDRAENIDPADDASQYAYAENAGWLNAEPSGNGGPGVQVGDSELSGWMWGENIGWVSLSCSNTLSCATTAYGVTNDGSGNLAGYAWAENSGWLSFSCANTASCGTASYGVTIDPTTGDFSGNAWAENLGWVTFASTGANPYKVSSGWICSPAPGAPSGSPSLTAATSPSGLLLSWSLATGATGSDIVSGDLATLKSSGGNFGAATGQCVDDNRTTTSLLDSGGLSPGQGIWFLVRGQNCGGNGTYDSGASQVGLRDAEVAGSGNDCP